MASLDGALKSIMQGVSQQVPRERLDGQVSLQVNMLSDVVQGMRRRPGMRMRTTNLFGGTGWTREQVFATSVDVEDKNVHLLINTKTGELKTFNDQWAQLSTGTYPYLQADSASSIQTATLRGFLYICNTSKKPTKVVSNAGVIDPALTGFFYIKSAQYSKVFNVSVSVNGVVKTGTYTAPTGQNAGDAALATPDYVAQKLVESLNAGTPVNATMVREGSYVYLRSTVGPLTVSSDSGSTFIGVSSASHVTLIADLPARMPATANGMLVSVGNNIKTSNWYQFSSSQAAWLEAGAYGSASSLTNMPMRLRLDTTYAVEMPTYEGRLAGNDETNEDPAFLTEGVSGFGSFQGRLVLLCGPSICLSAAGKPLRWYRSTTTELLVADPISIFSGAATSTNFTHAIQFNKDLLLFSNSCQAVVPSGNSIIAPSTAQIVITSSYACTSKATPVVAGRSLLYFTPRSEAFAGVLELVPSNTTDSQYTSNDVTAHLPRYMPGVIRQATASTTSNSLALVADGDARTLFIQDYLWSGDEKQQSAWHSWTVPYDIVCTWFVRDTIYLGLLVGNAMTVVSIEPQAGSTVGGNTRPFSDLYQTVVVSNGTFTVPVQLRAAYSAGSRLLMTYATGDLAGEWVGLESVNTSTWVARTVRNTPNGTYMVGLRYRSAVSPTPPLLRDKDGIVIGTSRSILVRYELSMRNTGEFQVLIQRNNEQLSSGAYSGLTFSSNDLLPNAPLEGELSRVIVPVRAVSQDTATTFYTEDDHDIGVLTVEYVLQFHARRRRA